MDQLKQEGVIVEHPDGGFVLRQPSPEELVELFDLREMIECHAIARAAARVTDQDIDGLERLVQRIGESAKLVESLGLKKLSGEIAECVDAADAEFHLRILQISGNAMLMDMVREQNLFSRIFGHRHITGDLSLQATLNRIYLHHTRIIEALGSKDARTAREAMAEHLADARTRVSTHRDSLAQDMASDQPFDSPRSGAHLKAIVDLENNLGHAREAL